MRNWRRTGKKRKMGLKEEEERLKEGSEEVEEEEDKS